MPKAPTFPTLFDEVKTISISFLREHGYLKPDQWKNGTINWSRNGINTGSISIWVCIQPEIPFIEFTYKCNGAPINYRVKLVSFTSNLGKGVVWYFICPSTGKLCRKLYLADTYFYHRSAFSGCMYENQTRSKKNRNFHKIMWLYFGTDELFEQLYKKHFKKQYSGKPTKKYLKIKQKIQNAENVNLQEILYSH